jgi:hypothetical protein
MRHAPTQCECSAPSHACLPGPPLPQLIELNLVVWVGYLTNRNAGNAIKELEVRGSDRT